MVNLQKIKEKFSKVKVFIDYSDYLFSIFQIYMLSLLYVVFYTYIINMFKFFNVIQKLNEIIASILLKVQVLAFIITLIFLALIRFHWLNFVFVVLSVLIEVLINKQIIHFFLPVTYLFNYSTQYKIKGFPVGFFIYLSYFIAFFTAKSSKKKDKKLKMFLALFFVNLTFFLVYSFIYLHGNLVIKVLANLILIIYLISAYFVNKLIIKKLKQ